jgi:hypothetical protein
MARSGLAPGRHGGHAVTLGAARLELEFTQGRRMRNRQLQLSTLGLVIALVTALLLGAVGSATAGGLTKGAVKKIATKVVKKQGPTLSVSHAASADNATALAGKPPSAYQNTATIYSASVTTAAGTATFVIPSTPGASYEASYSAYLGGSSGRSGCYFQTDTPTDSDYHFWGVDIDTATSGGGFSGTGQITVPIGETLSLYCFSASSFTTYNYQPIQVSLLPLSAVANGGALSPAARGAAVRESRRP